MHLLVNNKYYTDIIVVSKNRSRTRCIHVPLAWAFVGYNNDPILRVFLSNI